MSLTDDLTLYNLTVVDKLELNKETIGLQDVWLGDQDRLPRTPCAAVEPGPKTRDPNGAPRRFQVTLDCYIMVYVEKIQDSAANVQLLMETTERVEEVLHADATLGGIVIHSYVAEAEPGYARRGGTSMRAARLTFRAISQVMLPYP